MGYVSIAQQLITILETIEDIAVVYDHEPDTLGQYPAATVSSLSHRDQFHDTAANNRSYTFLIRLHYRTDVDNDAEDILRSVTDQVIAAFETQGNVSIPDVWHIARPTAATWTFGEREVPERMVEITIAIEQRVNR